jgi:large subunit ribosomal protein L10
MNREQKAAAIAEIAGNIDESQAIFAVDYRGISVPQVAELRAKLREADATFRVVKNSLTERAADETGTPELKAYLKGPTALTFVRGDAALAAKAVADYARATQLLPFKGGLMDGNEVDADQIRAISRLPSREALYGQLVGIVASPISGLVRTLGALVGGLAVALGQVQEKKASGEIPAGEPPSPAEAPAPQETPAEPEAEAAVEETPSSAVAEEAPVPAAVEEAPASAAAEEGSAPAVAEEAPAPDAVEEPSAPAAAEEAPVVQDAPENQTEPDSEPATDDNPTEASADLDQPETAEANKED